MLTFFPEDFTPWRRVALNLVVDFFTSGRGVDGVSKHVRWSHYDYLSWKMTFWALVAEVLRKLRTPLPSWNWDETPSKKAALPPFMGFTTSWVSALLACQIPCKKPFQRECGFFGGRSCRNTTSLTSGGEESFRAAGYNSAARGSN